MHTCARAQRCLGCAGAVATDRSTSPPMMMLVSRMATNKAARCATQQCQTLVLQAYSNKQTNPG
eukprot:13267794-Ditylum_brightwellii.AAC.1